MDRIACERIRSVIRGLKSFVRVDTGDRRPVNLSTQLRDTLKLTHAEFGDRITVETDVDELPEVECYPQMLNQVFLNLLVNAARPSTAKAGSRSAAGSRTAGCTCRSRIRAAA